MADLFARGGAKLLLEEMKKNKGPVAEYEVETEETAAPKRTRRVKVRRAPHKEDSGTKRRGALLSHFMKQGMSLGDASKECVKYKANGYKL